MSWLAAATVLGGFMSGRGAREGAKEGAAATRYGADKSFAASEYGTEAGAWSNLLAYNQNALQGRENQKLAKDFASWGVNVLAPQEQRNKRQAAKDALSLANSPEAKEAARFQSGLGAARDSYAATAGLRGTFGPSYQDLVNQRMLGIG